VTVDSDADTFRPISTLALREALPHRPPMVWIDEVTSLHTQGGECALTVQAGALYLGPAGLRRSSLIELMAQAYGFVRAARALTGTIAAAEQAPKRAFLAAIQNAEFFRSESAASLQPGARLRVTVEGERQLGPITMFTAQVRSSSDQVLASARLKVFAE